MTLTLAHGRRCAPCKHLWHFLCWARRDALCPDACVCDCRDADGFTTEAAFLESARRAPVELARHLRYQQAADLLVGGFDVHPESVAALVPVSVESGVAQTKDHRNEKD